MKLEDIQKRVVELIQKANNIIISKKANGSGLIRIKASELIGLKTGALSLILKIYNSNHPYYLEIDKLTNYNYPITASKILNILNSVKEEVTGGWLFTTKGLVSSEIFANFIEMAEHLLSENYKDPAAVMIGSVLEEHLRQLCLKNDTEIDIEKEKKTIPKKADRLNSDLATNQIYNKLDQKSVTAWLDLRNKAAHGKYSEYTKDQVQVMSFGVLDFLTRNSI
jgi:hypothetical protein